MAYPMYQQNYQQYPAYQPYPQGGYFQNGNSQAAPQPMPQQQAPPAVNNSAPISIRGEQQAIDWPIAPGNSLTFIDEAAGYVYTKTSLNQFDRPQFVKYRLVREEPQEAPARPSEPSDASAVSQPSYALKSDVEAVSGAVEAFREELAEFRARMDEFAAKEQGTGKKEGGVNG